MDTQTIPEGGAAAVASVKPSVADEFLAAFKAEAKPEPVKPADVAAKPEGETAEVVAETVETVAEPAKVAEKPTSLARRLAMVAQAERNDKARKEADAKARGEQEARDKEIAPIIERINKARGAKSKMEAAATVLGLNDDEIAELYLELHEHHSKSEGETGEAAKNPLANLEQTVAKLLDAKLKERDTAHKENAEKVLNDQRAAYTVETLSVLDARGDEFPLVAIAPPGQVDITAISEAWLVANGEIPEPETVLKMIQDSRQKNHDERTARAKAKGNAAGSEKKSGESAAPGKPGETSGSNASTKRDDVPLKSTAGRKPTVAEEFLAAFREANPAT